MAKLSIKKLFIFNTLFLQFVLSLLYPEKYTVFV